MAMFPSGDTPTHVMFFVVEMGNVSDVLLRMEEKTSDLFFTGVEEHSTPGSTKEHLDSHSEELLQNLF